MTSLPEIRDHHEKDITNSEEVIYISNNNIYGEGNYFRHEKYLKSNRLTLWLHDHTTYGVTLLQPAIDKVDDRL